MNNSLACVLSFFGGAAIGAVTAWKITEKIVEKKYAKIAQDEIDSVKERFTVPKPIKEEPKKEEKKETPIQKAPSKPSLADYAKRINEYTNYSNVEGNEEKEKKMEPYVITPDEFGEDDEYDQQELTYYADGILADDDDKILDADKVLGKGSIDRIGEYEDDALHVKDEKLKLYYEILVDERSYERATGKSPDLNKDEEDE